MQFAYHGDKVHFYSDLIHGTIIIKILKIAYILVGLLNKAISFFFFSTFNTFKKILMLIFVSHFLVLNKSCINHFWANFPIFSVLLVFAFFFKKKKKKRETFPVWEPHEVRQPGITLFSAFSLSPRHTLNFSRKYSCFLFYLLLKKPFK